MFGKLHLNLPRSSSSSSRNSIRIYSRDNLEDKFYLFKKKDEIRAVLDKIDKIYSQVELGEDLLDMGFCFGLMDPTTNILINSAISRLFSLAPRAGAEGEGEGGGGGGGGGMTQRSLDGLIAFLTCLFPYLPDAEARRYLDVANGYPLLAVLLIINRRGIREFDFFSPTTVAAAETALRCAAVAAKHPDPQRLVLGWKILSPFLRQICFLPSSSPNRIRSNHIRRKVGDIILRAQKVIQDALEADGTSDLQLQLRASWDLAHAKLRVEKSWPFRYYTRYKELPPARGPMKRMLLATIHGCYLQALGKLPTDELRSQYHHSILKGGYCYGPLDPVSNIIVNAIWYERNFPMPTNKKFAVDMISTKCLWRIVAQSLYGLVSFLCTRYPHLTPDLAMQRLLLFGANLRAADPNLSDTHSSTQQEHLKFVGCNQNEPGTPTNVHRQFSWVETPSTGVLEAYAAAATASFHPCPLALTDFLGSQAGNKLEFASEVLMQNNGAPLSTEDHSLLCFILDKCPSFVVHSPQEQDLAPKKIKKSIYSYLCRSRSRFWGQHERVSSMVETALAGLNRNQEHSYKLHIICGANEFVSGPVFSSGEIGDYNPWTPHKYYHTHINFLAVCEGRPIDPPTLFFAECGKDGDNTCWCVPVVPQKPCGEQVRCIYCEHEEGNRIVHPAVGSFCGRDEFEKLYYVSKGGFYTNDRVMTNKIVSVDWVHDVEDDAIYFNHCADDASDSGEDDIDIW